MSDRRAEEWPDIAVPDNHADVLSAWLHTHQAVEVVQTAMTAEMQAAAGCTLLEHEALFRLATSAERRMSMLRLADALATSPSGATRLVERLVRRGWVVREQPSDNRRQTDAVLTDDGYRALTELTRSAYHQALTNCFGGLLTARDLADLRRIGRKLLDGHGRFDQRRFADLETRPDGAAGPS
jgi:DNA-binding MarR family transcriptional regulator